MKNGQFLTQTLTHRSNYIVDGLIASNRLNLWASPPGEGKSIVAGALGYSVAYGAPFLNMPVDCGNVMFIDSENRYDILKSRAIKIKNGLAIDGYKMKGKVDFQHYSGFLLDNNSTWPAIEAEIKAIEPSLIILDHLACFHHQNEDREDKMKIVTDAIEKVMTIKDSSVLVLHHFNKLDIGSFFKRLRGSSALYAKSDAACEVRTLSVNQGRLEKVGLIPQPRKDITSAPIRVRIDEGKDDEGEDWLKLVYDGTYKPLDDPRTDDLAHKLYHVFLGPNAEQLTVKAVLAIVERYAPDPEVRAGLRLLEHGKGLITSERKGLGGGFHYTLTPNTTGHKYMECPWCNKRYLC